MRFFIIFLFCVFANAGVVTKSYTNKATGEGYGTSYEAAIDKALAQAVLKLNGAKIQISTSVNSDLSSVNNENELYKRFNQQISKATNGSFNAFEVLSKEQTNNGFRVIVEIKKTSTIKSYKAPGMQTKRRKIVVAPALEPNTFSLLGRDSEQVSRDLRFKIQSNINKTRKFQLLDRHATSAFEDEKKIILGEGGKDEALKLGHTLGTDYFLLYAINDISTEEGKISKITGIKSNGKSKITLSHQVILLATREIKLSNSFTMEFANKSYDNYQEILDALAKQIVIKTLSAIYPLKIEKLSNNQAVLTQSIDVGTTLDCYKKGDKIYDSYTKELNSYEEIYSSTIQITHSTEKSSYAKILKGTANVGDICRYKQEQNEAYQDNLEVDFKGGFIF